MFLTSLGIPPTITRNVVVPGFIIFGFLFLFGVIRDSKPLEPILDVFVFVGLKHFHLIISKIEILVFQSIYNISQALTMNNRMEDQISYATNKKNTIKLKVVFIGDQNVGKSSIINRFIKNQFDASNNPTVGIDFVSKSICVNQKSVRLQLWDTAGQQRFRSLIPGYLRDSNAVFLVYDVTSGQSYNNLNIWIDYIKENRGDDVMTYIIGNKIDAKEDRVVERQLAQEKFNQEGLSFAEVSAKTGQNIDQLFSDACASLMKLPDLETTLTLDNKGVRNLISQKEKPAVQKPISNHPTKKEIQTEVRGSKLMNHPNKGNYVKQKNCC